MRFLDVRSGLAALLVVVLLPGCALSGADRDEAAAIEAFAGEFLSAWESGDPYDSARFFSPSVGVTLLQSDEVLGLSAGFPGTMAQGEGRSWLSSWVGSQTMTGRQLLDVFVYDEGFMQMSAIAQHETVSMTTEVMEDGLIGHHSMLRWRSAHSPGGVEDDRLAWADALVDEHLAAWSPAGGIDPGYLYADDAVVKLGTAPTELDPDEVYATGVGMVREGRVVTVEVGDRSGRAVFVAPFPRSPWVVYVARSEVDGCTVDQVIALEVDDGQIVFEGRAPSLESIRSCGLDQLEQNGWWSDLEVPPPVDEQVTGVIVSPTGDSVEVVNGSPEMENLLAWGLDRFQRADLAVPAIEVITYGPVPACEGRTGVVYENDDGDPNLVMCTDASEACSPSITDCASFQPHARMALLHELAHVWLLAEVDDTIEAAFMEITGVPAWRTADVPWHQRGVEHAAEILAWGLMDEPTDLARIGSPSCSTLVDGYSTLTGRPPLNTCTQPP